MVPTAVQGEHAPEREDDDRFNVDSDRVQLIVTPAELKIVANALRSVGAVKLAERFEAASPPC
jgi:hypothetical protein